MSLYTVTPVLRDDGLYAHKVSMTNENDEPVPLEKELYEPYETSNLISFMQEVDAYPDVSEVSLVLGSRDSVFVVEWSSSHEAWRLSKEIEPVNEETGWGMDYVAYYPIFHDLLDDLPSLLGPSS